MDNRQNPSAEIDEARADVVRGRAETPADPATLTAGLIRLAKALKATDERVESESLFREALAIRRAAWPGDDVRVAVAATYLGRFLEESDRREEAEPLYREAVATFRTALPAGHPHLSLSLRNLAAVLDELRGDVRLDEAERLLREALKLSRADADCDPQTLAGSASDLGAHLCDRGQVAEADPLLAESLDGYRRNPNARGEDLSYTLVRVARLRLAQGRPIDAEAAAREALALREVDHPATDHRVAKAKSLLGLCLVQLGRPREAEALLTEALNILENNPRALAAGPSRIEETRRRLAMARDAQAA